MIYTSQEIEQTILILVILGHLLPFYPHKKPKNQNFEKWKNLLEVSFYTCVPKIIIIWCTVPETQSETQAEFCCHYEPFFVFSAPWQPRKSKFQNWYYNFTCLHIKWQSYDAWFLRCGAQHPEFFVILDDFFLFYPLTTPKIKLLKK